jgi:hypothetical protein
MLSLRMEIDVHRKGAMLARIFRRCAAKVIEDVCCFADRSGFPNA